MKENFKRNLRVYILITKCEITFYFVQNRSQLVENRTGNKNNNEIYFYDDVYFGQNIPSLRNIYIITRYEHEVHIIMYIVKKCIRVVTFTVKNITV